MATSPFRHRTVLAAASLACAALLIAPAAAAGDVLVWEAADGGYTTHWVSVDGGAATAIATRPEAVVSNGKTLWALQLVSKSVELWPCEALEEPDSGATAEGTFDWPGLKAVGLNGGGEHWIVKMEEGPYHGEVWNQAITLAGSAGPVAFVNHANSGYACGAHGFVDDGLVHWDVTKKDHAGDVLVDAKATGKKAVDALVALADAEDCMDDEDVSRDSVFFGGLSLSATSGGLSATGTWIHPTGADWQFACTLDKDVDVAPSAMVPALRPSAGVKAALKALKLSGSVGYAELTLTGAERDAALAAFKSAAVAKRATRTTASPAAQKFIETGRKLTKAKKYESAIKAFDTAIRKDATAARAWSGRGYAKLQAGKLDAAARDFDRALTLDATDDYHGAIWYNLGQIAEQSKDFSQAARAFQKSVTLRPNKAVEKALKRVTQKKK